MIDEVVTPEGAAALRRALEQEPDRLLSRIGVVMAAYSQEAFDRQRFGATLWPERYPNQQGEKVNVAGIVEDLETSGRPKQRRFDARPAGIDTGDLKRRVTFSVAGGTLEVGSAVPYAERFHEGGTSIQPISQTVRQRLSRWLTRESRTDPQRAVMLRRRLGHLFHVGSLSTTSPPRPFVGLTDEMIPEIEDVILEEIRRGSGRP